MSETVNWNPLSCSPRQRGYAIDLDNNLMELEALPTEKHPIVTIKVKKVCKPNRIQKKKSKPLPKETAPVRK